ncbi:MAG TPA: hypothetical protein VLB83_00190 [Candidatus Paceibacterota bacterium]|nr:hypothetical protein [Candidatus Paceibacterota bacterium]
MADKPVLLWFELLARFKDLASGDLEQLAFSCTRAESKDDAREIFYDQIMREHAITNLPPPWGPNGEFDQRIKIFIFWVGVIEITNPELIAYYDAKLNIPPPDPPPPKTPPRRPLRKKPGEPGKIVALDPKGKKPGKQS